MTDCRRISERLAAYADGSLEPAEQTRVERHLDACASCRVSASAEQQARAVLRARASHLQLPALPPGLRSRCEALSQEFIAGPAQRHWTTRLVPVAVASLLLVFTGAAILSLLTSGSDAVLAAQINADHTRCFRNFVGDDAPGIDANAAEATLAGFGFDVHVPASSPAAGVELVHVRRCLSAFGGVPHVLYRVQDMDLSLYVFGGTTRPRTDPGTDDHRSQVWARGETTFLAVFPAEGGVNLSRAVEYLMRETSQPPALQ